MNSTSVFMISLSVLDFFLFMTSLLGLFVLFGKSLGGWWRSADNGVEARNAVSLVVSMVAGGYFRVINACGSIARLWSSFWFGSYEAGAAMVS